MLINIFNNQEALQLSQEAVQKVVAEVIHLEKQRCHEVSIYFVDTPEMCRLHEQYFGDPSTTDCISFPMDDSEEEYRILGDVFVCPETAVRYASTHHTDPFNEITLYIIHGLLHLMGYDDMDEKDRKMMRLAEKKCMAKIKKNNIHLNPFLE